LRSLKLNRVPQAPWGLAPGQAIAVPIMRPKTAAPVGFLLAGINVCKRLDDDYRSFYSLVAEQLADAIWEAETSERERALRFRAETERAQVHDLLMNVPAAILMTAGPEHRIALMNRSYVELSGRSSETELIGKMFREALPELAGQVFFEQLDDVYRTGTPFIGKEVRGLLRRGPSGIEEERFFNCVYQPHRSEQGLTDGILIHATDVTEQVHARREIETREAQFRALADSIPQLAWMANPDGCIFWFNRRWYEYTGTTPEQMTGWGWQSVHDPKLLPEVLVGYRRSIQTGEPFDLVFPLRGGDGSFRSFLSRAVPVRDGVGNIVRWFGTNTDVEAQRKAEIALLQSEKLAAVGRLASSISHEINNPLAAMMNLIFLARSTASNEETRRYLKDAEEQLARVAQITTQTLRFYKQQSDAVSTDPAELLDSVLKLCRGRLSRDDIQLKLEVEKCPRLICYAGEVRQVLANLVGNALDAMPKAGTLHLRVRQGTDWRSDRRCVRFTIADTGHGISPETERHIFEPFFTTKGETGTGLGLWVSAGIVEKHKGSLRARSSARLGKSWTAFTMTIPYSGPATNQGDLMSNPIETAKSFGSAC
jgi:PAS domain S-box-containing protein